MQQQIKILIIEDENKIASLIEAYLVKEGFIVKIAGDGKSGIKFFETFEPDIVILDRMLPEKSGEEVFEWIKKRGETPVIMVTAKDREEDIVEGFTLGVDDYVTKPFSPKVLVLRIKNILKRKNIWQFKEKIAYKRLFIDPQTFEVIVNERKISLSPAEFKILYLLAKSPGRIYERELLLEMVFGDDAESFDRTIDAHIKNLRKKIEPDRKHPKFIKTVYGVGYKFEIEDEEV